MYVYIYIYHKQIYKQIFYIYIIKHDWILNMNVENLFWHMRLLKYILLVK